MGGGRRLRVAVREFLDEFELLSTRELQVAAIAERSPDTGDARFDAFLGGLAEHLAARESLERPAWATELARFLTRFWFYGEVPGFRGGPDRAVASGIPTPRDLHLRRRAGALLRSMDREAILAALRALGALLAARGVQAEMYIVGGAAIALAYDARRSTRDIDAVFEPRRWYTRRRGR